ncbi:DUF456 domain-containing protein [uncultured Enterococcus sp.]|uniref:DUF456 domain-containing protein n=1 Tax=uncultured Enterococcus sp. TaxID=167972 RepID=UPI0025FC7209|nr:DUF456 domain-containing protein [uncultured Enterococcus sp.]
MEKRVIVVTFDENALAYQGFSEVKKLYATKRLKVEQMAVVKHSETGDHKFSIEDFFDPTGSSATTTGGIIGMIVGVLVSPLAILLGWFGGSLIGASKDAKELSTAKNIFEHLINQINEGQTGLIIIAEEEDNRPLNEIVMQELGGSIHRFTFAEVEAEIQHAKEVEAETSESTKQNWLARHTK